MVCSSSCPSCALLNILVEMVTLWRVTLTGIAGISEPKEEERIVFLQKLTLFKNVKDTEESVQQKCWRHCKTTNNSHQNLVRWNVKVHRCKKKHERKLLQRMRSRSSASDWRRSRSKSELRQREKNIVEAEEERTPFAEKVRSRTSARSRSKSQMRQREIGIVEAEKERTTHQRSAGKMRSRTSVRDRGRSRSPWLRRSQSQLKQRGREDEGSKGGRGTEKEWRKSQRRQNEVGDGGRGKALVGRNPLHGMGDGEERRSRHQYRLYRRNSQLRQQEQGDGGRGKGHMGRRNKRSRSPPEERGDRMRVRDFVENQDEKRSPLHGKGGGAADEGSQQWGDHTSRSRRLKGESQLEGSFNGIKSEVGNMSELIKF